MIPNTQVAVFQIPNTLTRHRHVCSTVKDLHVDAVRDCKCLMHIIFELIYIYVVFVFFLVLLLYCIYNVAYFYRSVVNKSCSKLAYNPCRLHGRLSLTASAFMRLQPV